MIPIQNFRSKIINASKYYDFKRNSLIRALAIIVGQVTWIFLNAQTNWALLGFWNRETTLGKDLKFVAISVGCDRNQSFFSSKISEECGNYYGITLIRFLRLIGFGVNNYEFFYFGLTAATVMATSLLFYKYSSGAGILKQISWFFILFGPYYLLLINRGNIDQVIFTLLTISTYFSVKRRSNILFISLIICSLFKFYSLPVLIIYVYARARRNVYMWVCTIVVSLEIAREVQNIDFTPIRNISSSFGVSIIIDYYSKLQEFPNPFKIVVLLFFCIFTFSLVLLFMLRKSWQSSFISILYPESLKTIYLLHHLFCFIAFLNYDWRLIYIIFFLFIYSSGTSKTLNEKNYISFSLIIAWCGAGFNKIAIFGDLLLLSFFIYFSMGVCNFLFLQGSEFLGINKRN